MCECVCTCINARAHGCMWVCIGVRVAYGGVQGSRLYQVGWNKTEKSALAEGGLEKGF